MRPAWRWATAAAALAALIGVGVATAPQWLRPVVESRASAALGRDVSIGRLEIRSWRPPRLVLHNLRIASPPALAQLAPDFATLRELALTLDLAPVWRGGLPNVPEAALTGLHATAVETPDGANNYTFTLAGGGGGAAPRIGMVRVQDSVAELNLARRQVQARVALATEEGGAIVAELQGSYGTQPITGHLRGAPVTDLTQATTQPYAVEARLDSGTARLTATGTVAGPLQPAAARLRLELAGTDLRGLHPLTGIPFPPTPPFSLAGDAVFEGGIATLTGLQGRLGSSDLRGDLALDLRADRPVLSGTLASARVDLQDLAGFIGSQPGRPTTPGLTPAQRQAVARAEAHPRLIPNMPMDIPKIMAADFHIAYRGERIIGTWVPFDSLATKLDIDQGRIRVTELRLAVGRGAIAGSIDMAPAEGGMRTRADLQLQRLDVRRLLDAAGDIFQGNGLIGGRIELDSVGRSFAEILQRGTGRLTFVMAGGSVSQLVVDLSGLQLGEALLSGLGLPERAPVRCLIGDLALARGALATRTLLLDTEDDRTTVQGSVDLRTEAVSAVLRTQAKHFTIGTLSTPILVTGTLKNPQFAPEGGELAARGAAAVGLGLLLAPAALLPTIQLGIGEDNACAAIAREAPPRPAR
jgi:uncharacterized protein involved in outer membrane biogenesis